MEESRFREKASTGCLLLAINRDLKPRKVVKTGIGTIIQRFITNISMVNLEIKDLIQG